MRNSKQLRHQITKKVLEQQDKDYPGKTANDDYQFTWIIGWSRKPNLDNFLIQIPLKQDFQGYETLVLCSYDTHYTTA